MDDIQQQTDVEMARARLEGVQKPEEEKPSLPSPVKRRDISKETSKGIRPVKAKPKKKKFGEKLKEAFFGDIGDGTITEHIFFNIFIPSFKRVLSDMGNTAINMALGLDPKTRTIGTTHSHVANASVYRDRNYNRSPSAQAGYSRREAVSDYVWDEETAKDIYSQLSDLIEQCGKATLADAYVIMDMPSKVRSTDYHWGWTSMRNAEVYAVDQHEEEWVVDMPAAKPV